jgi:3-deoxy-D-manno-octulosonate 8-phosphate phosphatase (KDO 8-P phosphatase)
MLMQYTDSIKDKLKNVNLLLLDVDGVLTDGSIIYHHDGTETKIFNVKDGLGIRLLMDAGIQTGIVTGRSSNALLHRCRNLGIKHIFDGIKDKASVINKISEQTGVSSGQTAFMGDDLPDLPLMRRVGLAAATADAHETVKKHAHIITSLKGGYGAVREICEAILKAKGFWQEIEARYLLSTTPELKTQGLVR